MKKLLVTAIGAAAALGASAGLISTQRFENVSGELPLAATISSLNALAGGTFWSGDELTNTYTYVSCAGEAIDPQVDEPPLGTPTKALEVKTTFGSPLTVNAIAGGSSTNIPASGIYFDSLVKFTVCEEEPEQTYDGAKIIMWLQEDYEADGDTIKGTNIMVRASYVNADGTCTPTNFVCYTFDGDIDAWHRVTIKTWADITNGSGIPGFAIFIDNELVNVESDATMADAFVGNLTEAAGYFGKTKVFASLVQGDAIGKTTITSASFDGTGKLTDLVFTDVAPFDAAKDYVAPKASVTIGGISRNYDTLADAVDAVNGASEGQTATFQFKKGMALGLNETLAFESDANVILDFAGVIITNESDSVPAISIDTGDATFTITNSTETVGGVYCDDEDGAALAFVSGELAIYGGIFDGEVGLDAGVDVYGGSYRDDTNIEDYLAEGKAISEKGATYPDLYDVIDIVYYTVGFYDDVQGEGQLIGTEASVAAGTLATAPAAPTKTGYTFVDWTPSTNTAITANTNFYPTWSANSYTITYYDGENVLDLAPASYTYGTGVTLPASAGAKTGYTFDGWYDNAGLTGDPVTAVAASETGNQTFYAKYTADTYTITFVNEIGADPASTNYTIESGAITLPTATTENMGVQFDGWTNGTYTTATNIFTPSAANLADFTLYAAWSSTGSSGFDGGDGNSFTIDPGAVATVETATGHQMTDTVAGTDMTYAQAYALGLVNESTGAVDELDATIEIKDGKVVVGLSSTPLNYTITLKVYEKSSLTAASWTLKATYTLGSDTATTGFTPSAGGTNFYKTEVSISNKE